LFTSEPPQTQYDLHFRIAGIPVRVHPLFWLMCIVLGAPTGDSGASGEPTAENPAVVLLIWVGVVFVSILVHELGHAFTMQYFGQAARVVMYMMGGLAIPESSPWRSGSTHRSRGPGEQILISAAGPGAGFLLAGIVFGSVVAAGGSVVWLRFFGVVPLPWAIPPLTANVYLDELVYSLLSVNIFWGLMNLLPVYPLDGGHISRELFVSGDPYGGILKSLWLSVIVAIVVAVGGLMGMGRGGIYLAILFGSLAFSNYQLIQHLGGRRW
jgi:Zn-dependent protease